MTTLTDIDTVCAAIQTAIPEAFAVSVSRCLIRGNYSWTASITVPARGKDLRVLKRPETLNSHGDSLEDLEKSTIGYYRYHTTGKL